MVSLFNESCKEIYFISSLFFDKSKLIKFNVFLDDLWIFLLATIYISLLSAKNVFIVILCKYTVLTFYLALQTIYFFNNKIHSKTLWIIIFFLSFYDFSLLSFVYFKPIIFFFDIFYVFKNHRLFSLFFCKDYSLYSFFAFSFLFDFLIFSNKINNFFNVCVHILRFHILKINILHIIFNNLFEKTSCNKFSSNIDENIFVYEWKIFDYKVFIDSFHVSIYFPPLLNNPPLNERFLNQFSEYFQRFIEDKHKTYNINIKFNVVSHSYNNIASNNIVSNNIISNNIISNHIASNHIASNNIDIVHITFSECNLNHFIKKITENISLEFTKPVITFVRFLSNIILLIILICSTIDLCFNVYKINIKNIL